MKAIKLFSAASWQYFSQAVQELTTVFLATISLKQN